MTARYEALAPEPEARSTAELRGWPMGLRLTCIAAPIQVEGPVDGGYVYFRARGGQWALAIGHDQNSAVDATLDGPCFAGSWRSDDPADHDEARAILAEFLPKLPLLRGANRA